MVRLTTARTLSGLERSKKQFALIVAIPILVYMLFWTVLPYLWIVLLSFFEYSPRRLGGSFLGLGRDNPFVGFQHFMDILNFSADAPRHAQLFHKAFINTLLFSVLVVPVNLMLTIPLAVLVNNIRKHPKIANGFRTLFFAPVITSSVGVGIIWGYIFNPQRGILNLFLSKALGNRVAIAWLRDANLTFIGIPVPLIAILIAYLWMDIGYNFVIFLAGLQNIPDSIMEAAEMDGASPYHKLIKITVPLLIPQILLTSVLTTISAFQIYDLVQVMTRGGPNHITRVIILDIFLNAFRYQKMGWAAAVSIVFFLVVLVISLVQTRLLKHDWEY